MQPSVSQHAVRNYHVPGRVERWPKVTVSSVLRHVDVPRFGGRFSVLVSDLRLCYASLDLTPQGSLAAQPTEALVIAAVPGCVGEHVHS